MKMKILNPKIKNLLPKSTWNPFSEKIHKLNPNMEIPRFILFLHVKNQQNS